MEKVRGTQLRVCNERIILKIQQENLHKGQIWVGTSPGISISSIPHQPADGFK